MYLFDAQNRWGYEISIKASIAVKDMVYLFDAQNRWGYEIRSKNGLLLAMCIYSMLRIVGVMRTVCKYLYP